MQGQAVSSTRMEAAAILLSLLIPRSVEIATDSQSALSRLQKLVRARNMGNPDVGLDPDSGPATITNGGLWPRRFVNMIDGDLWIAINRVLAIRPPHSVHARKVKAHADSMDVERGVITPQDLKGNSEADIAATRAVQGKYPGLTPLLKSLAKKQDEMSAVTSCMHTMAIAILRDASHHARIASRVLPKGQAHTVLVEIPVPEEQAPCIEPRCCQLRHVAVGCTGGWQAQLLTFIVSHEWRHTPAQPLPWVALLAMFELVTGKLVSSGGSRASLLKPRTSTKEVVACFRTSFMKAVREGVHAQDRHVFATTSQGHHMLRPLGFFGFQSCITACPVIEPGVMLKVWSAVIALRKNLPSQWAHALTSGTLKLARAQINLTSPPPGGLVCRWWFQRMGCPLPGHTRLVALADVAPL